MWIKAGTTEFLTKDFARQAAAEIAHIRLGIKLEEDDTQLSSDDESDEEGVYDVKKASARLKAGTSESESGESVESF